MASVAGEFPVTTRAQHHATWVRICHGIATASIFALAFSGFVILMAHPRLYWGDAGNDLTPALIELPVSRNYKHSGYDAPSPFFETAAVPVSASRTYNIFNMNGWARSLHFLAAWFLVLSGGVYLLAGVLGGHFRSHVWPGAGELTPRRIWRDFLQHLHLRIPPGTGGPHYGVLQKCAYSFVVFVAAPLLVVTGSTMAPAVTAAFPFLLNLFGGFQSARTIHFFCFVSLLAFAFVHVLMVVKSGFRRQIRAMTLGDEMKTTGLITRRRAIVTGLASLGGLALARYPNGLPPTYGNLLRMGDTFTYAAHRVLLPGQSLVREYGHDDITSVPAIGTTDPGALTRPELAGLADEYRRLKSGAFGGWRLSVEGRVATARTFTLAELKQLPSRTQITRHTCEEGWSAIVKWTGAPLSRVLDAVGILPTARFVVFYSFDDWVDSIDLLDALHPQTMLAYGMNGRDLPIPHGAPVRLRVERQLGYKSMKYLRRLVVVDEFEDGGKQGNIQNGWAWYAGI